MPCIAVYLEYESFDGLFVEFWLFQFIWILTARFCFLEKADNGLAHSLNLHLSCYICLG